MAYCGPSLLETQNEESSKDEDGSTENKDGDTSD